MDGQAQAPERLIKLPEVATRIGLGKTMIYQMVKEGSFPKPYKVCGAATRWSEQEVAAWISSIKQAPGIGDRGSPSPPAART